jgi:hypothetical protein
MRYEASKDQGDQKQPSVANFGIPGFPGFLLFVGFAKVLFVLQCCV